MTNPQVFAVIEEAIKKPPIPHEPAKESLKGWAMYCLRDKGFKVVYAQNADFAIERKGDKNIYFKVSNTNDNLDQDMNWIIWDSSSKTASIIVSQSM